MRKNLGKDIKSHAGDLLLLLVVEMPQYFSSFRSISLVGESERKLLKEIVKQAKNPVKSRIVASEIINKFKNKLRGFEEDVQEILKQEKEDKEVNNLSETAEYPVQKKCAIWRPTIEIMKSTR